MTLRREEPGMHPSPGYSSSVFDPVFAPLLDVMGPTVQFVTPPRPGEPCVMRGVIPPGAVIPIHSHPDPETFIQLSGEVDALAMASEGFALSLIHI